MAAITQRAAEHVPLFVCFLPTMEHILLGSALAGLVRYVAGQDGENIVMSEFDAVRIGTSLLTRA